MKKKKSKRIFKSYFEVLPVFVAILISGILFSEHFPTNFYVLWISISLVTFILSFFIKSSKAKNVAVIISALSASMFFGAVRNIEKTDFSDILILDGSSGTIYGRYTGQSSIIGKNKISYIFSEVTFTTNEQKVELPLNIDCRCILNRQRLYPEQYYSMTGKLKIVSFDKAPVFEISDFSEANPKLPSVLTFAKTVQEKIKHGLDSVLTPEHSSIVKGFILGDTTGIKDKSIFIETGISHILAISGQHIIILIFLLAAILHWLKIPPISRSIFISIILIFYAMITVGSPSVWRALIMYISATVILLLESSASPIRPVSLAAFILIAFNPSFLKNSAFILSFTAVLSIIFLKEPFEYAFSKLHFPKFLGRYFSVTFAANLGTMPMVAYLFGTVSLSSILVNPLVLWAFTFILPTAFFISFISIFSISMATFLSSGLTILLDILIKFLQFVKSNIGLYFYVGNINPVFVIFIYSFMLFFISVFNRIQVKKYLRSFSKKNKKVVIDKINIAELPKEKEVEIHIDGESKATPTLIGDKNQNLPKLNKEPAKEYKPDNPFENVDIVLAIDAILSKLKRIRLFSLERSNEIVPIKNFSFNSQNLYYMLFEMEEDLFLREEKRLLQAHIYMLAIAGFEFIYRLNIDLKPYYTLEYLDLKDRVTDKFLSVAVTFDLIIKSRYIDSITESNLKEILKDGEKLYFKTQFLLNKILANKNFKSCVKEHLTLREDFIKWCWKFIQCDNLIKLQKKKNLR